MSEKRYVDFEEKMGEGVLQDWFINSVDSTNEPVWTEAHIAELVRDFIVIPRETKVIVIKNYNSIEQLQKENAQLKLDLKCFNCVNRNACLLLSDYVSKEEREQQCPYLKGGIENE